MIQMLILILRSGIPKEQLTNLKQYLHFRQGYQPDPKAVEQNISTFDENIDIFEPIANDAPQGKNS